ncbi:Peptidase S53 propeptide, partial [mine drainage metagenome]
MTLLATDDGGYQPDEEPGLPRSIALGVAAVVGLNQHPASARGPRPIVPLAEALFSGYRPAQIEGAYGIDQLPPATPAARAVILEFASGYSQSDLDLFTATMQLPSVRPILHDVDGGANDGGTAAVDLEATLDIEWLWAMAPGCDLHVIEAPSGASDGSFGLHLVHALAEAMNLGATVVSVSYGDAESHFPPAVLTAIDAMIVRLQKTGADVFIA